MIAQLTKNERQLALIILLAMSACGLAMAVAGRDDPLGIHGAIVLLAGIAGSFGVISGYYAPEPSGSSRPATAIASPHADIASRIMSASCRSFFVSWAIMRRGLPQATG